ncbi:MAG: hypothetical protein L0Y50_03820 [Beijerinckiaceae bacterium]|nr:hypothetical protein [Beijerinckiaceae bacterium]MCI0735390.1 hypothetical protein [Beijerinckiaceae bacterium]
MRFRLTPPSALVFFLSFALAAAAVATVYTHVPVAGNYVAAHRFWIMTAAYALLLAGVIFRRL